MTTALPRILYDNRLEDGTPAASTTAAGYDVLNLRDWRAYTCWKPTALPATVTVDCGTAVACDAAALYGHDCASRGNTVEIRGSTDNFGASDVLVATSTPSTDAPLLVTFTSVSYRYWRLRFTGGTAPTIAIAVMGAALPLPTYMPAGFDPLGRTPRPGVRRDAGHALGRSVVFEDWRQELAFTAIDWVWFRTTWLPAWDAHLRGNPFLFAWDSGDHATDTRLVTAAEMGFVAPHNADDRADLRLSVAGVAS